MAEGAGHRPQVDPRLCRSRVAGAGRARRVPAATARRRRRRRGGVLGGRAPFPATTDELRRASGRGECARPGGLRALSEPRRNAARAVPWRRAVLVETAADADRDRGASAHALRRGWDRHRRCRERGCGEWTGARRVALAHQGIVSGARDPRGARRVAERRELREPGQGLRGTDDAAAGGCSWRC